MPGKVKAFALFLTVLISSAAAQPYPPRLYETTIETGLPHLEENLRYATTRSTKPTKSPTGRSL